MKILTTLAAVILIALSIDPSIAQTATTQIAPNSNTIVDFSPVVNSVIQASAAILSAFGVPIGIYAINWLRHKAHLANLQVDDAQRAILDEGWQKALGAAVVAVKAKAAANPANFDMHSAIAAEAATYMIKTFPDALDHFGISDPEKVREMANAVLGQSAIRNADGAHPVLTAATPTPVAAPQT